VLLLVRQAVLLLGQPVGRAVHLLRGFALRLEVVELRGRFRDGLLCRGYLFFDLLYLGALRSRYGVRGFGRHP